MDRGRLATGTPEHTQRSGNVLQMQLNLYIIQNNKIHFFLIVANTSNNNYVILTMYQNIIDHNRLQSMCMMKYKTMHASLQRKGKFLYSD